MLKTLKKGLLGLVVLAAILASWQYFFDSKYKFPDTKPFAGNSFYNPYKDLDSSQWQLANFHAHTRAWKGLSNGRNNTNQLVDSIYRYLGYSIYSISDYQEINTFEKQHSWYVPVYEHAFLPSKNHQLVLNAKSVCWLDYFFSQTLNNMQHVINELKEDTSCLVAIAHPHLQDRYAPGDFKYLCNYDLIEVLNYQKNSIAYWDSALSSGHASFIIGDDDTHDLNNTYTVGIDATFINTALQTDSIFSALRRGRAYGVEIYMHDNEPYSQKREIIRKLPHLKEVVLQGDTLIISISEKVKSFSFIGQNGNVKKSIPNAEEARYVFTAEDTYIRTEITMSDMSVFYLNPVFRFDGINIPKYTATVDSVKTWLWRIGFLPGLFLLFFIYKRIAR